MEKNRKSDTCPISYEKYNGIVCRLFYLSSCITSYLYIYILFMTIFSADVIYWFNFLRLDIAFREYLSFDRVILYCANMRPPPPALRVFTHHVLAWRFEFLLICKQKCFVCLRTIRDFSRIPPSFISFYIYNVSNGDICIRRIFTLRILSRRRWVTSRNMR